MKDRLWDILFLTFALILFIIGYILIEDMLLLILTLAYLITCSVVGYLGSKFEKFKGEKNDQ